MTTTEEAMQWAVSNARESATYMREEYNPETGEWYEQEVFDPVVFAQNLAGGLLGCIMGVHLNGDLERTVEVLDAAAQVYMDAILPVAKEVVLDNMPQPQPTTVHPEEPRTGQMTPEEVEALLKEHEEDNDDD